MAYHTCHPFTSLSIKGKATALPLSEVPGNQPGREGLCSRWLINCPVTTSIHPRKVSTHQLPTKGASLLLVQISKINYRYPLNNTG